MQTKIIPANEVTSSNTLRLTPVAIGELLYKCNDDQLESAIAELLRLTEAYMPIARVDRCLEILNQTTIRSNNK